MLFGLIIFFLILSAFFSGSEIAFVSANKLGVEIKRTRGSTRGAILASFYHQPERFLSAMLVGNIIVLVILSFLLSQFFTALLHPYLGYSISLLLTNAFIIAIIIILFGEFIPKALFRLYSIELLTILAYPLLFFYKLLSAPVWLLSKLATFILRYLFNTPITQQNKSFTRLDLEHFLQGTYPLSDESIDADIFKNALNLKQVRVKDCMVPRPEIVSIDVDASVEDLRKVVAASNLSRVLVIKGDIDNVQGYIHHQQLFKKHESINSMVLDLPFVPETLNVHDLMVRMNKLRISIACVVDEFGGTSGIITLEDILERIFGEIEDEHDQEEFINHKISENEFMFSGRLDIHFLNSSYHLDLPEGDYQTLSGYLVSLTGEIPEQGTTAESESFIFVFELVGDKKIETVRIIRKQKIQS